MISRYSGDNNLLQAVQNLLKLSVPVHVGSTNVKLLCWVVILLPEINKQKLDVSREGPSSRVSIVTLDEGPSLETSSFCSEYISFIAA
jgi:hypothetical protein